MAQAYQLSSGFSFAKPRPRKAKHSPQLSVQAELAHNYYILNIYTAIHLPPRIQQLQIKQRSTSRSFRRSFLRCFPSTKRPVQSELGPNGISKSNFNLQSVFLYHIFVRLKWFYQEHAALLHKTGGGLNDGDMDRDVHHKYADCYIPTTGPDWSTTGRTKNIWGV